MLSQLTSQLSGITRKIQLVCLENRSLQQELVSLRADQCSFRNEIAIHNLTTPMTSALVAPNAPVKTRLVPTEELSLAPVTPMQSSRPPSRMPGTRRQASLTTILRWNCRGMKQKRAALQFICTLDQKPVVIAVQEGNMWVTLPGYISYGLIGTYPTLTFVNKAASAVHHITPQHGCNHTLLGLLSPSTKTKSTIFILNIY